MASVRVFSQNSNRPGALPVLVFAGGGRRPPFYLSDDKQRAGQFFRRPDRPSGCGSAYARLRMASRNKARSFAHGAPRHRPDRYRISVELPDEPARGRRLDCVSYAGAGAERVCVADAGFTTAFPTAGAGRADFRSTLPGKMDHGVVPGDLLYDLALSLFLRRAVVDCRLFDFDLPLVGRTEPGEPQARLHLPRRPDSQLCRDEGLFLV